MNRREFLKAGTVAAAGAWLGDRSAEVAPAAETPAAPVPVRDRLCLFTDHLDDHGYRYAEVAKMLRPLRIAGPDLTVRGGGLVRPEQVAEELPRAAEAFRNEGMTIPMISTNLTSARDAAARPTLAAMNNLGIRYFKLGNYHYHDLARWEAELETQRKDLAGLLELARQYQVQAGLHNHSGAAIGGALWDGWEFLRPLDPALVGFYFDPGHATIEGAKHSWKLNLQRHAPRVTMIALKDYVWEKRPGGWQTRWCPLGEGMVNWPEFFALLERVPFAGPVSIHIEYEPGGSTRMEKIDRALAAAEHDLAFVRKHLK